MEWTRIGRSRSGRYICVFFLHDMTRVCINFRDLNKACPKDNYPTPFVDQIVDECAGNEIFSFMDGFSGYNQITSLYLSLGHVCIQEDAFWS